MLTAHPCYEQLANSKQARLQAYSQLFGNPDADSLNTEIHRGVTKNLATGSEKFKVEIQALTGVAQVLKPRGPTKKPGQEFLL